MKNLFVYSLSLAMIAGGLMSCDNAALERKVEMLENRVDQLESGHSGSTPMATPVVTPEAEPIPDGPLPSIIFAESDYDFGTVSEGDIVEHTFSFTNTGEAPLIISNATASCGCTVPDWPRDPIAVGETGVISVKFDSKGKPGNQNKTVSITANTNPRVTRLQIRGMVSPSATAAE